MEEIRLKLDKALIAIDERIVNKEYMDVEEWLELESWSRKLNAIIKDIDCYWIDKDTSSV